LDLHAWALIPGSAATGNNKADVRPNSLIKLFTKNSPRQKFGSRLAIKLMNVAASTDGLTLIAQRVKKK
jgi:hypothetical protein